MPAIREGRCHEVLDSPGSGAAWVIASVQRASLFFFDNAAAPW